MFREAQLQILAIVLFGVGGFQFLSGLTFAEAAKREVTTVGTISSVDCGRTCTYFYVFEANGVRIQDDSSVCKTPLTAQRCKQGAPVRVYYDPEDLSVSMLQELGAAGRGRLFFGLGMVFFGLLSICLKFFLETRGMQSDATDKHGDGEPAEDSDVLHIVSKE